MRCMLGAHRQRSATRLRLAWRWSPPEPPNRRTAERLMAPVVVATAGGDAMASTEGVRANGDGETETPWRHSHPPRGTCEPRCLLYGRCHCGCGARPKFSQVTFASSGRVAGRPFTFVPGHQLRVLHPRAGTWSRNGVPVEAIRPLLFWLRERHGSIRAVSRLLQMPEGTIRGYVYNRRRKRVPPQTAKRITDLVLAHRKRAGLLDMWEEEPGLRPVVSLLRLTRRRTP